MAILVGKGFIHNFLRYLSLLCFGLLVMIQGDPAEVISSYIHLSSVGEYIFRFVVIALGFVGGLNITKLLVSGSKTIKKTDIWK